MATLFGDDDNQPPKKARRKQQSDGSTAKLMALYQDEHQKRHGCTAMLGTTYAHAMRVFKELKEQCGGEDEAAEVVRAFIWSKDTRIASGGYTVKELAWHAPRLRLQARGKVQTLDPVTAHNIAEAERAAKGRSR